MAKPRRMSVIDRTGQRYGRLLVLSRASNIETPHGPVTQWYCRCDCGNEVFVRGPGLAKGAAGKGGTRSCGCLTREKPVKHGLSRSPVYRVWHLMVQRCTNPNSTHWMSYGGRGITVCDEWRDFAAFYADMGAPKPSMTLERIDNERGYSPANCRWATRREQGNNRRTNVFLSWNGKKMTVADWGRETGLGPRVIKKRLSSGWSIGRALSQPIEARKARRS